MHTERTQARAGQLRIVRPRAGKGYSSVRIAVTFGFLATEACLTISSVKPCHEVRPDEVRW